MSLVAVAPYILPGWFSLMANRAGTTSFRIDTELEEVAGLITFPEDGTLTKIGVLVATATEPDTFSLRLETMNQATGEPSGTLIIANAEGTFTPIASTVIWVELNGGAGVSVSQGGEAVIRIQWNDWAGEGSNGDAAIFYVVAVSQGDKPHVLTRNAAGAWTAGTGSPNFALQYSGGNITPAMGTFPAVSEPQMTFNNTDNPNRIGNKFRVSVPMTISGIRGIIDLDGDTDVILYDSDETSILGTASFDKDVRVGTSFSLITAYFASDVDLTPSVDYRIVYVPQSATDIRITSYRAQDDGANKGLDGLHGGISWIKTSTNNPAGGWTDDDTDIITLGLIVTKNDDGTGGGGPVRRVGGLLAR